MVDLLKHNSLLKGWSWSALQSEHYWQALTSLPWYVLLKSSHSLPPCYTGTDASVCTCAQPFSRLQEQGSQLRAHSEEERSQESLWHSFLLFQVHPLQYTPYYPAVIPLWLSFPPQAVILVLNFDETKPGVARGIYLFRSKCNISVNILELQRRMIGQLLLSLQNGFLYFYQSVKGNTCLESTNVFFLSDIPDTFGCTLKLVLALNIIHTSIHRHQKKVNFLTVALLSLCLQFQLTVLNNWQHGI